LLLLNGGLFHLAGLDVAFNAAVNPAEDGTSLSGSFIVRWNANYQSLLSFHAATYSNAVTNLPGFGKALQIQENKQFQFDLLPLSYATSLFGYPLELFIGGSYIALNETALAMLHDTEGYLVSPGTYFFYSNKRNADIFSPRFGVGFSGYMFTSTYIAYTGYISPLYLLEMNQTMEYDFLPQNGTNSLARWSGPLLEQSFSITFFTIVRAVFEHTFQYLNFQTMDWLDDSLTKLVAVDDAQTLTTLKYGCELLLPINTGLVRFKGGIYFSSDAILSSYWGQISNRNKIQFRIGIEG